MTPLEMFKEQTEATSDVPTIIDQAEKYLDFIEQGAEAHVYEYGGSVVKISEDTGNLRGEYIVFLDPDYEDITPDVYSHHPDWKWIEVERVEVLDDWDPFYRRTPEFFEHADSNDRFYTLIDLDEGILPNLQRGNPPEWWNDIPSDEREFWNSIVDMHDSLGLTVHDILPQNFGYDRRGNLVMIDIYTKPRRRNASRQRIARCDGCGRPILDSHTFNRNDITHKQN
jgi:hypothetical protein